MMNNSQNVINTLVAAVECSQALDLPHDEGVEVLQKHGFDYNNRFDLPATKFVKQKQDEALALALEEKKA